MAEQAQQKNWLMRAFEWASRNSDQTFLGQLAAIGREIVKDTRGAVHQFFFGRPEGMSEPGTPLNPTPQIVTGQLTGKEVSPDMPEGNGKKTMAQLLKYAEERAAEATKRMENGQDKGKAQDRGMEM